MKTPLILAAVLSSLATALVQADGSHVLSTQTASRATAPVTLASADRYEHKHSGGMETQANADVDFGAPADVRSTDRSIAFGLKASGGVSSTSQGVEARERIRFELSNGSTQATAFVIGDEHAIREYADAFKTNPDSVKADFHGVQLTAGQSQKFAWKFDTYGTNVVYAAYVGSDGSFTDKMMKIQVMPAHRR